MNNKRIPQAIGVIFLLITTSVHSKERASDQQKNHSKQIENSINLGKESFPLRARVTTYSATETKRVYNKKTKKYTTVNNSDPDTRKGKTATGVNIFKVQEMGLVVFAVDPAIMPWGSVGLFVDNNGNDQVGVAVDTGGNVKSKKASGGKAPVIDMYTNKAKTPTYHNFKIIKYVGPNFRDKLNDTERLQHLERIKNAFVTPNRQLAAR